ncbi:MAG: SnoaL-like domain-containing protein [Ginsengibacter sp.]
MQNQNFTAIILVDQTPEEVFNAINDVRGWWSEEIEGDTKKLNDEFTYHYQDVHHCKMKIIESVRGKKVVWLCTDNYFSFTKDKSEWIGTKIIFEIAKENNRTSLCFTHEGLVPEYECYNACVNGWTQYITQSLPALLANGKGQPNSKEKAYTIHEIAGRFKQLAQQEKWFEIQDELFAENVKSIEPENSPYFAYAEGKDNVRKKSEGFLKKIETLHSAKTTEPIIGGNHFAVGREVDITVQGSGRIQMNEIMLYEVKDGKIISEQFFY